MKKVRDRFAIGPAAVDGLAVEQHDTGSAKGAVVLKWSLKNNSGKEISVPDVNLFVDHQFVVKDQNNRTVKFTERGQQAATASYFTLHRRTTVLASGEAVTRELQITDFYDMKLTACTRSQSNAESQVQMARAQKHSIQPRESQNRWLIVIKFDTTRSAGVFVLPSAKRV